MLFLFSEYPLIGKYIKGTTASGLYEAQLGREEMGLENHVFSGLPPAGYGRARTDLRSYYFQFRKSSSGTYLPVPRLPEPQSRTSHQPGMLHAGRPCGIYDPCAPAPADAGYPRLRFYRRTGRSCGRSSFHTLCEQNSDDLETTLRAVEKKFGKWLFKMNWLNMGGGHHITREDYDIERLISCINHMRRNVWSSDLPGAREAVAFKRRLQCHGSSRYC